MVRLTRSGRIGNAGLYYVMGAFAEIGWGAVSNAEADAGTDLWVQATDEHSYLLRRNVGVQVKTGPSYFEHPGEENGEAGWWYRESGSDHFDDWLHHNDPHLIVLHDLEAHVSYWTHVKPSAVRLTGQGRKIFVPKSQTIDGQQSAALREVALSHDVLLSPGGTPVDPLTGAVAAGCELRYALLAPRLVAPDPHSELPRQRS